MTSAPDPTSSSGGFHIAMYDDNLAFTAIQETGTDTIVD